MRYKHEVMYEQNQFWTIPRSTVIQITFYLRHIDVSHVVWKVSLWQLDPPSAWSPSASIFPPMLLIYVSFTSIYEQAVERHRVVPVFKKKHRVASNVPILAMNW